MLQEQMILYIRENMMIIAASFGGISFLLLLINFFQVAGMRREVHQICKKIHKYFEIVLSDNPLEKTEEDFKERQIKEAPAYQGSDEKQLQEERKKEEDVKLLMDVISEVF